MLKTAKLLLQDPEIRGEYWPLLLQTSSAWRNVLQNLTEDCHTVFEILNDVDVSLTGLHKFQEKFQSVLKNNPSRGVLRFNRVTNEEEFYLNKEFPKICY